MNTTTNDSYLGIPLSKTIETRLPKIRVSWLRLGFCATVFAAIALFSYFCVGIVYDEAWNWNEYARLGTKFTYTHYSANNHVLYGLLMSFIPLKWVNKEPFFIRTANFGVVILLLGIITAYTKMLKNTTLRFSLFAIVFLSILFSSPQFSYYLFVGRGHLLAATLALLALYLRNPKFKWQIASDFVLALATYSISTFNYLLPGLFFVDWFKYGLTKALIRGVRTVTFSLLLFGPNLQGLMKERLLYRERFPFWFEYPKLALGGTFSLPVTDWNIWVGVAVFCLATVLTFVALWKSRKQSISDNTWVAAYLLAAILSFFCVVQFFNYIHYVEPPWQRNALFVSPFLVIALLLLLDSSRWKIPALAFFTVNFLMCFNVYRPVLLDGNIPDLPLSDNSGPSLINSRRLKQLPRGTELNCTSYGIAACYIYQPLMEAKGIKLRQTYPNPDEIDLGCRVGKHPARCKIEIYYKKPTETTYGRFCY